MTDTTAQTETEEGQTTVRVRPYQDADRLRQLYHEEGLTQREIAERFDLDPSTITRWMAEYGIETHSNQIQDGDGGGEV